MGEVKQKVMKAPFYAFLAVILLFLCWTGCSSHRNVQVGENRDQGYPLRCVEDYNEGMEHFIEGNYTEAISCFKRALDGRDDYVKPMYGLGLAYQMQGQKQKAVEWYERAMQTDPNFPQAYQSLGNLYYLSGEYDKALEVYKRCNEKNLFYPRALNNIATIYYQRGEYRKALENFENAILVDPDYARAHYGLGLVYHQLKKPDKAIEEFRIAIKVGEIPEAIYMIGVIKEEGKDYRGAYRSYQKFLRVAPKGEWAQKARERIRNIKEKPVDLTETYPNPFGPTTTVDFILAHSDQVTIRVLDSSRKMIREICNRHLEAGKYQIDFGCRGNEAENVICWQPVDDSGNWLVGVFLCQIETPEEFMERKFVLIK